MDQHTIKRCVRAREALQADALARLAAIELPPRHAAGPAGELLAAWLAR